MNRTRPFLPALVLLCGCLLISDIREQATVPLAAPLTTLAAGIDGYTMRDVTISEDERRVAGMSDYSMRVYERGPASSFSVYVGYYDSQAQGKTIHSPRNCLPGAGWETLHGGTRALASPLGQQFTVNRYVLMNGSRQALVYYWYQGRGRLESNEYRVKWNLLRDAALSGRTEEALVRIVVPLPRVSLTDTAVSSRAYAAADEIAERVARRLVDEVDRVLPAPYGAVAHVATSSVRPR